MNYRKLIKYGFYNDRGSHIIVLNKNKVDFYGVNLDEQKENIKVFFNADTLVLE